MSGVQVSWLADRCLRHAFPGPHPVAPFRLRLLAHSCATAPASHRIPLVPVKILRALDAETYRAHVLRRRHRKIETIGREREVKVGLGEAWPVTARELLIALRVDECPEQVRDICALAPHDSFDVASARVVLGKIARGNEGHGLRPS